MILTRRGRILKHVAVSTLVYGSSAALVMLATITLAAYLNGYHS